MLAYRFANGTDIPTGYGPLRAVIVGPEGLLTMPKEPTVSGGKPWAKSVTNVNLWWIADFDCTHEVDYSDIVHFVDVYIGANGGTPPSQTIRQRCDFNLDASINYDDIIAFVDCYIAANTP
jgi:hypothetical protein